MISLLFSLAWPDQIQPCLARHQPLRFSVVCITAIHVHQPIPAFHPAHSTAQICPASKALDETSRCVLPVLHPFDVPDAPASITDCISLRRGYQQVRSHVVPRTTTRRLLDITHQYQTPGSSTLNQSRPARNPSPRTSRHDGQLHVRRHRRGRRRDPPKQGTR